MNWRLKALVQRAVASLPRPMGDAVYYRLQRHLGSLRKPEPTSRLKGAAGVVERLRTHGSGVVDKRVLEVGTGWRLNLPLGLWLCGAAEIVTVDLNPYLREELVLHDLAFYREKRDVVQGILGHCCDSETLAARLSRLGQCRRLEELLRVARIRHLAPADAARLDLPDDSFDVHVSYTVLEHVPTPVIRDILHEGRRLLADSGLFVHKIDFSDHFSHSDRRISSVNFLRFSEQAWRFWGGTRFMYHNRLRVEGFKALVREAGLRIVEMETLVDEEGVRWLESGHPVDPQFRANPPEVNATRNAWLVARSRDTSSRR